MQKYISLFFSVLLFAACKQAEAPPPNIIAEPQMVKLLTDLHIADGELYTYTPIADTLFKYGKEKYNVLFKKYHVTEKQFDDSYKYYSQDPEKIQAIYGKIDLALKAKLDSLNKNSVKEPDNAPAKPAVIKNDKVKRLKIDSAINTPVRKRMEMRLKTSKKNNALPQQ